MELTQTLINALVVALVGLLLARMTQGLRAELKNEIAELRAELKGDIAELRAELKGDIAELRAEMREELRAIRSDLTQVALALGARPRAENA